MPLGSEQKNHFPAATDQRKALYIHTHIYKVNTVSDILENYVQRFNFARINLYSSLVSSTRDFCILNFNLFTVYSFELEDIKLKKV